MDEESLFQQNFFKLPSSFSLKVEELTKSKHVESQKKKLELLCETNEFEITTEWIRVYNLLSFLHWKTDDRDKAYELNRKALDLGKQNVVARCNRVWMQWQDGQMTEANEELDEVEKLTESEKDLLLEGKAEVAYAYSTFGPRYFSQSINMYNTLLDEINDKDIHAKYVQLWKMDMGLIYRKFCNPGNIVPNQDWRERNINDCIEKAASLFYGVVSSNSPARWKGRCFASLAELSYMMFSGICKTKSQQVLFPKEIADKDSENLLNMALAECEKDSYVLKICGKQFKYLEKLDKAEEMLRKSITIMETSYGHHHLALVLKKKLMNRISEARSRQMRNECVLNIRKKESELNTTPDYQYSSSQSHISSDEQKRQKASVKGYSRVFSIPVEEKETVEEIMSHLDKAIQFGNEWASVEKGLLFRQIKEMKKAFETFLKTLNMKELGTATVTVTCYEHLGACCRDLALEEEDPEKKRKFNSDAIKYFRKAIETMARKVSQELYFLKDGWMAYSSVKDMFQPQKRDVATLKILSELSIMLGKYGESLDFYKQIVQLDEAQSKDPAIIRGQIQILIKNGDFEQAAVLLDLQSCTEKNYKINEEFCKFVYLKCAFHLLSTGEKENSGQRFRQAFDIGYADKPKVETYFDIFFLYDEDVETEKDGNTSPASALAINFKEILPGNPGLRTTRNSENVKAGSWERKEQTHQMETSAHIIVILDTNNDPQGELQYFIKVAQEIDKENKSKLSLIIVDGCLCPRELTAFPRITFDKKLLQSKDEFIQWTQNFFYCLLGVQDSEKWQSNI